MKLWKENSILFSPMNGQLDALEEKLPASNGQNVEPIPLNPLSCARLGAKEKCSYVLVKNKNYASTPQVPHLPI